MPSDPTWKPIGGLAGAIVERLRAQMARKAAAKDAKPVARLQVQEAAE